MIATLSLEARMAKISKARQDALVRRHGAQGARYLAKVRQTSSNPYLQKALQEIEREAEEADQALAIVRPTN